MDWNKPSTVDVIKQRLAWLDQRQQVLARNIANSDTPKFTPSDLKPPRVEDAARPPAGGLPLAVTAPTHLPGVTRGDARFAVVSAPDSDPSPSGNAVDLEQQAAKLSETALTHKFATQLYRKYLGMIRIATNSRG